MTTTATFRNRLLYGLIALNLLLAAVKILPGAGMYWDFSNYYNAGFRVLTGHPSDLYQPSPQTATPHNPNVVGLIPSKFEFVSAPITAYLWAPLALVPPRYALRLLKMESAAAMILALFLLFRVYRRLAAQKPSDNPWFAVQCAAIALIFQPLWSIFSVGGQATPLVFLLMTAALVCTLENRQFLNAACWVLLVLVKPVFIVGLAVLVIVSGRRFFLATVSVGAAIALLSIVATGWPLQLEFVQRVIRASAEPIPWRFNSAVTSLLDTVSIRLNPGVAARLPAIKLALTAVRLMVALSFVWLLLKSRSWVWPAPARRHFQFQIAILVALMTAPVVWEHYLIVLLIPLLYFVACLPQLNREAKLFLAAILLCCVTQTVEFTARVAQHFEFSSWPALIAICLFRSLPLILIGIFALRCSDQWFGAYRSPQWSALARQNHGSIPVTAPAAAQ